MPQHCHFWFMLLLPPLALLQPSASLATPPRHAPVHQPSIAQRTGQPLPQLASLLAGQPGSRSYPRSQPRSGTLLESLESPLEFQPRPPVAPALLFPDASDLLDNGCTNLGSGIFWTFIWADVPNATQYHLYVIGATATTPVLDLPNLRATEYISKRTGSYIADQNRRGWRWKVRARVNGQWTAWSEERLFDVEPVNTDCSPSFDPSL